MARDFDGTNDVVDCGSDASIEGFVTQSICCWVQGDSTAAYHIVGKSNFAAQWQFLLQGASGGRLNFNRDWTTTDGEWHTGANAIGTTLAHVAVVYDGGATTNDPVFYINGVSVSVTETTGPAGTLVSDATTTALRFGLNSGNTQDLDGRMGWVVYANALFTAEQVNRARWWGTPGGPVAVYHPLMTTKLANEGTATAPGSASGTVMTSIPKVERMWASIMGCGR